MVIHQIIVANEGWRAVFYDGDDDQLEQAVQKYIEQGDGAL